MCAPHALAGNLFCGFPASGAHTRSRGGFTKGAPTEIIKGCANDDPYELKTGSRAVRMPVRNALPSREGERCACHEPRQASQPSGRIVAVRLALPRLHYRGVEQTKQPDDGNPE